MCIRDSILSRLGDSDARYIRRVVSAQRSAELGGRALLFAGLFPPAWAAGVGLLALSKILENMEIDVYKRQVYAYAPRILHSKTAVFDGRFTVIGSHNLDALSLSHNLECDVVVDSLEFGRVVLDVFEDDLTHAHRLDLASWRRRSMLLLSLIHI